jgi:Winged helix DNA-binding domain
MASPSWDEVIARRLERSSLLTRGSDAVAVAGDVLGVHAQVQVSAELQLAARVDGIVRGDVRSALWQRRELAKAWTIRGTLHLHPAAELPLWLAARRAVADRAELAEWRDPAGVVHPPLGADDVAAARAAVWEALDGRCLLRAELADAVVRHVGPAVRARLTSGFAFFLGDLCHGPPRGAKITLARPDQWLRGWREVAADAALHEACRRFVHTYGPVRPVDFSEWFGVEPAAARGLFDTLDLQQVDVEGHTAWVLRGDARFPASSPSVRLLPEYDVYVMAFRERERLVPERVRGQVAAHGRGRYEGPAGVRFVVVDGVCAGVWERKLSGKRVELRVSLARRLTRAQRAALGDEAERIGTFLGAEPSLAVEQGPRAGA